MKIRIVHPQDGHAGILTVKDKDGREYDVLLSDVLPEQDSDPGRSRTDDTVDGAGSVRYSDVFSACIVKSKIVALERKPS